MTTSYDAIDAAGESVSTGPESDAEPSHTMTFVPPDGNRELVHINVTGVLPVPRLRDPVGVHSHLASVMHASTNYGRDEGTGRVVVNTLVRVLAEGDVL